MTLSGPPAAGGPNLALLLDRRLAWLLMAIAVILVVALSIVGFSGAFFTSTSKSPGNEFAAGGVSFTLSETGPLVDGNGMAPGDNRSGDQTVTNTGHQAVLKLSADNVDQASALIDVLNVRVQQTSPALPDPVYSGPLESLVRVRLGTFLRDEVRTYSVTVIWPENQDSLSLRGAQTSLEFDWKMESVP